MTNVCRNLIKLSFRNPAEFRTIFMQIPSRIRAFKVLILSTKKPFKRRHQIADPIRVVRRFCTIFSASPKGLPSRPSRAHFGRLHAWPWSVPRLALVGSMPGLFFELWRGNPERNPIRACSSVCSPPTLRRRLHERNPASSLSLCLLLTVPSAPTPRSKSGFKPACLLVARLPLGIDLPSEIRPQACPHPQNRPAGCRTWRGKSATHLDCSAC